MYAVNVSRILNARVNPTTHVYGVHMRRKLSIKIMATPVPINGSMPRGSSVNSNGVCHTLKAHDTPFLNFVFHETADTTFTGTLQEAVSRP
jgi:riboflavin synthase alpha subunit